MQAVGRSVLTRGGRVVVATAGLMVLLALQPESVRLVEPAAAGLSPSATAVRTLIISEQARRYLALQYRSFPTEFMGCMIGEVHGATVIVQRVAPAVVGYCLGFTFYRASCSAGFSFSCRRKQTPHVSQVRTVHRLSASRSQA